MLYRFGKVVSKNLFNNRFLNRKEHIEYPATKYFVTLREQMWLKSAGAIAIIKPNTKKYSYCISQLVSQSEILKSTKMKNFNLQ